LVTGKSHECHAAYSVLSPGPTLPDPSTPCRPPPKHLKFWSVGQSVGRSVGHREVAQTSRCLIQFLHPGALFPTLLRPAGHPQNGLKFWLVGWLVGRSRGSHINVMLPLQFRHPGPPFPTLLRPVGHPQNGLEFWLVGWLVDRSVRWSVRRSRGSHTNITLPLQFRHPGLPFLTLLRPAGHPQNDLKFWLVGRSVTGKSHKRHAAYSVLSPGPALPDPSTPCGPPPRRP
jgi:predicted RNA binding protein YcfA (HicA-like mRNA interferase family)